MQPTKRTLHSHRRPSAQRAGDWETGAGGRRSQRSNPAATQRLRRGGERVRPVRLRQPVRGAAYDEHRTTRIEASRGPGTRIPMIPGVAPQLAAPPAASAPQPRHMFVFGAGFVGRYVSERLLAQGWQVSGTCTSAAKKRELEMLGMSASVFDATESNLENIHSLQQATHLLISIPPIPGIGDPLLNLNEDLRRILSHGNLEWLCYLSSTSVYGDCGGALVDEDYTVNPKSESAKLRFKAEKGWLNLMDDLDLPAFIFRLGGIYGPGRSALYTLAKSKSLSQRQKLRESKQYTARIHVADIYQAILASMSIRARKILNVVDDDPAPRAEVFAFARSLMQRRYPDLITKTIDVKSTGLDYKESIIPAEKQVSNARLKQELGVKLLHPTYRSGLQSILDSWQLES